MWENNAVMMTYNQREGNKPAIPPCLLGELAGEQELRLVLTTDSSLFAVFMAFSITLLICCWRLLFADKGC